VVDLIEVNGCNASGAVRPLLLGGFGGMLPQKVGI